MNTIYILRYPEGTPYAHTVFFVGCDETGQGWKQEAQQFTPGRQPSQTSRTIHYLWRNKRQPVHTIELQTDDPIQTQERYRQLLAQYKGPRLTNRVRSGV
jgi:hypothetical protein